MNDPRTIEVPTEARGRRLDQFLVQFLSAQGEPVSRSRVQLLIDQGDVLVAGKPEKASTKLRGGERITITGEPHPAPLKATAENIPLDVIYEDADLAVINKPAGMMVHAGAGASDDERSRGTLKVNAFCHSTAFRAISSSHRRRTAPRHRSPSRQEHQRIHRRGQKTDRAHAALGEMFASRRIKKDLHGVLVQGSKWSGQEDTITAGVSRDPVRRTRMTTQPNDNARTAVSH